MKGMPEVCEGGDGNGKRVEMKQKERSAHMMGYPREEMR